MADNNITRTELQLTVLRAVAASEEKIIKKMDGEFKELTNKLNGTPQRLTHIESEIREIKTNRDRTFLSVNQAFNKSIDRTHERIDENDKSIVKMRITAAKEGRKWGMISVVANFFAGLLGNPFGGE